jgi:hypothetical protein
VQMAVVAGLAPALVVDHLQNDVWTRRVCGSLGLAAKERKEREDEHGLPVGQLNGWQLNVPGLISKSDVSRLIALAEALSMCHVQSALC